MGTGRNGKAESHSRTPLDSYSVSVMNWIYDVQCSIVYADVQYC